jgi:hypothetical protein
MKTSTKRKAISKKVIGNTNAGNGSVDISTIAKKWGKLNYKSTKGGGVTPEEREYLRGYDDGARSQAEVFEKYMDLQEAVSDYHSWNKIGKSNINWCAIILGVVLLGIVMQMIVTDYNYGFINA